MHEVRARWLGHKVHADLHITVDSHLTVAESHGIVERVHDVLRDHVPGVRWRQYPRLSGYNQPSHSQAASRRLINSPPDEHVQ